MKIGVSTLGGDGGKSGISQYIRALLKEFAALQSSELQFEVIAHEDELDFFLPERELPFVTVSPALRPPRKNQLWHQTHLPGLCRQRGYDVLFLTAGNRRLAWSLPCPSVGTVFDFSLLHIKGKYGPVQEFYITQVLPALARRLTHVITLSDASKKDIIQFAKVPESRITVIPAAADPERFQVRSECEARRVVAERLKLEKPYLLYVSRIEHPGKNHYRLIEAFEILKKKWVLPHQLVFVGSDWNGAEEVHARAEASPLKDEILFTGFTPSELLPHLYAAADAFVFPSLWEGFGLPVLEAMQAGVPVACSNVASLPEVAGDAAVLFDPSQPETIAAALEKLVLDDLLLEELRQRGLSRASQFSWRRAAEETISVLQRAAQR